MQPSREIIAAEVERWSRAILDSGLAERWIEGAIFPREMAFFMGCASAAGVELIVESGRQDGYSTEILGLAGVGGQKIVSIDYEEDKARGTRCRARLAHLPIEMVVGDAFEKIGKIVQGTDRPTALLIDGPKSWGAISIGFAAAAWPNVKVIALHNLPEGYSTRAFFEKRAGAPVVFEDILPGPAMPAFQELGDIEHRYSQSLNAGRDLEKSSLGLIVVGPALHKVLPWAVHSGFRTYPPIMVWLLWKLQAYGILRQVFRWTNRLGGYEKAA
jgi:hypothetical protein